MFTTISFIRSAFTGLFMVLGITLLAGGSANAQSVCKGLSKTKCESNDKCSHVKASTRTDGTKVTAHCRSKPGNGAKKTSAKKKAPEKKKTATKKATETKKATAKKADAKNTTVKKKVKAKKPPKKKVVKKKAAKSS